MESEKRLIDANALEKDMRAYADNKAYCGHIELANGILKAVGRIDEAPTVDAVEVVRCENCENAVPFSWAAAGERVQGFRCMKDEGAIGYKCCVSGDDFCASGKRRINDAND